MFDLYAQPKTLLIRRKLVLAALLSVVFVPATTEAKKNPPPNYGTIKIQSHPANLPLELDGKSYGMTSSEYTAISLIAGIHTIAITLPDGNVWRREVELRAGRIKCISVRYRPPTVVATAPCPFPVKLFGPAQVSDGEIISFGSEASYTGPSSLHYTWIVSPANARVLNGDGTNKIAVDTTGLGGQRITATVRVDDGSADAGCSQIREVSTLVSTVEKQPPAATKFDSCCSCSYDDQKARLDNFAIELQNDPSATAYIIVFTRPSRRGTKDNASLTRSRDYLVTHRGLSASRIVLIDGGYSDYDCLELWMVPQGAKPPIPASNPGTRPGVKNQEPQR